MQRKIGGWNFRSRLDALSTDLAEVRGFVQSITPTGCILLAEGFANPRSAAVTSVNLEQPFAVARGAGSLGMRLPIERRPPPAPAPSFFSKYIWGARSPPPPSKAPFNPSLTLRYNLGNTGLFLSGNTQRQSLTVRQRILSRTFLAPTIATDGAWSVSATQSVGNRGGSLNAVVRPGDSLTVSYGQYPLQASLVLANGGRGATVFVKRSVPAFS